MAETFSKVIGAALGALLLSLSFGSVADTVTPGSACHAITPAQASRMEWREQGMVNTDPSKDWWIVCPFTRGISFAEHRVSLRVFNDANEDIPMSCNFREIYAGRQVKGGQKSVTVPAGDNATLEWTMTPDYEDSVVNAACRLPEGLQIEAVITRDGQSGGGSGGGSSEVYACETAPDDYYGSSESIVNMRNGTQLNNYNGLTWLSSDSVVIFRTRAGDWYGIINDEEYERLDVIREPDSCFDAEYEPVLKVESFGGSKRVYVDGGYVVVSNACDINTTSKLWAYSPSFSTAYIVDFNTGEECLVQDAVQD